MSSWQKISLRDAVGKVVFDDEWGFIEFDGNISYLVGGRDLSSYYAEVDGQKIRITPRTDKVKDLMSLFSKIIYYRNQNYGYYGRNQEQYLSVEVEEITVNISCSNWHRDTYGRRYSNSNTYSFVINKKDKKRLEYLRYVWICDELQSDTFNAETYLKQPLLKDLNEGDEIFFDKKYKIAKIYPQPNEKSLMLAAVPNFEGATETAVDISFNDKIYILPYEEQPIFEFEQFNNKNNEFELSPYVVKTADRVNVYWNKLDDASEYIISVYKDFLRPYMQRVYHLKDYTADRNDGFISIDGLNGSGYIITVKAENRGGEEIALSRGIKVSDNTQCVPQYWKEQ